MKLPELLYEDNKDPGMGWSDSEFAAILAEIKTTDHGLDYIKNLAAEVKEKSGMLRTVGGIELAMIRMSIMIHGTVPDGISIGRALKFFGTPGTISKFLQKKGYDVEVKVRKAREDLDKRIAVEKKTMSKDAAKQVMATYYKENKKFLPKDIATHRDHIISDIMKGMPDDAAFDKWG